MKQYLKLRDNRTIHFDGPEISPTKWRKVKKAVENIEGKWNSSTQAWDFPFDVTRLYEIIQSKDFKLSSHYQFFETERWLIENYMSFRYQWIEREAYDCSYKVLEPSAGRGSILKFLTDWGLDPDFCEVMPENREILQSKGYTNLVAEDFFTLDRPDYYDLVFANPPFNKDKKHIKKMFEVCKPGGTVVTLASENIWDDSKFVTWINGQAAALDVVVISPHREDADFIIGEPIFKDTNVGCTLIVAKKL